ncbi:5-oxoprolinase [Lentinula edodes]|nr:5-oxoprolinase [Lentinula edodes]
MQKSIIPDRSIQICADRGGTFCDVHASYPDPENSEKRKEIVVKLLSQDPSNYSDAPTEGIRRVLEIVTGESIPRNVMLNTDKIDYIRLSTTVATNALLERKGHKHALLITKGFKDLLLIGNQSRPKIFDLNIRRPPPLYTKVVEVDERVTLVGYTSDPQAEEHAVQFDENGKVKRGYRGMGWDGEGDAEGPGEIVQGISGEAVRIIKKPDADVLRKDLQALYDEGYRSIAIVLVHSYTYPEHERFVGSIARSIGFEHVSESAQLLPMIKMVPRGVSSTADAYLTPILRDYLNGFFSGFDEKLKDGRLKSPRVEFMGSDGGLVDYQWFSGLKSILSGPAGGVVGYALTSWDETRKRPIIGLDVGGTSTDVSRFAGRYEVVYETSTAGVTIQSPQLDINTVASGGGSCLQFRNGLFVTGPESAGAQPGPACYRKGGPLAVTDANLLLGRIIPDYFPKIFGKSEKEPLDVDASRVLFEKVVDEVNASGSSTGTDADAGSRKKLSMDEVVYGFIKVANETMCRPIRALTEARGYATSKHILASFGGAGGQHACEIAKLLGINTILIHRYSSILSAYGLALADRAYEVQEPSSTFYTPQNRPLLIYRMDKIETDVREELKKQGFEGNRVHVERMLNMRFEGTDTSLMVLPDPNERLEGEDGGDGGEDFLKAFRRVYKAEFGFLLEGKTIIVDDIKVRGIGKTFDTLGESVYNEVEKLQSSNAIKAVNSFDPSLSPAKPDKADATWSVYFDEPVGRVDNTPVFQLEKLEIGDEVHGPAMIIDDTQTIVVIPGARALLTSKHLYITLQ